MDGWAWSLGIDDISQRSQDTDLLFRLVLDRILMLTFIARISTLLCPITLCENHAINVGALLALLALLTLLTLL